MKSTKKSSTKSASNSLSTLQNWLQLAQLRFEKCEFAEAEAAYGFALQHAKKIKDLRGAMEALAGLLRLAGEALDEVSMGRWEKELDAFMTAYPKQVPPLAWYCKGTIAWYHDEIRSAQRFFHRYLRSVKTAKSLSVAGNITPEEALAKGWLVLAQMWKLKKVRRALTVTHAVLKRYQALNLKGINGNAFLNLGSIASAQRDVESALQWYQKAHVAFLSEHNWYYHLYALLGYARLNRVQQNYPQAYWYLDMLDKASHSPQFAMLRREIALERSRLEQDAVDLLIDSRKCLIKTREMGQVSLRKQYVLLHILEALSSAHGRTGDDIERGLSKAEIIEKVWKETYRPEAHDNKLYYNINRLRKLIEPDVKKPQYLLNWKEGYRLAPGLRVHLVGNQSIRLGTGTTGLDINLGADAGDDESQGFEGFDE